MGTWPISLIHESTGEFGTARGTRVWRYILKSMANEVFV